MVSPTLRKKMISILCPQSACAQSVLSIILVAKNAYDVPGFELRASRLNIVVVFLHGTDTYRDHLWLPSCIALQYCCLLIRGAPFSTFFCFCFILASRPSKTYSDYVSQYCASTSAFKEGNLMSACRPFPKRSR